MIRPSNCTSRWLWLLLIVDIWTVNVPAVTLVPLIVRWPVTDFVRPTAVWLCPASTSLTRYPTSEPLPIVQVPATGTAEVAWPAPELDGPALALLLSQIGSARPALP